MPGTPSEIVAEDSDAVYDGDLEDGDWAVEDLKCIPRNAIAERALEIRKCFRRILQAHWKAGVKVLQDLLESLSSWTESLIAVPYPAISPTLHRLEEQHNALREKVDRYQKRLLARENKLAANLINVRTMETELKTFLDASAARARCFKREAGTPQSRSS